MYELKVENQIGDVLTLTQNENDYQIQKIEGLSPANGIINTSSIVGMDGALFNSSKLDVKELVLYIKINGNAEKNRNRLYTYFAVKKICKIYYKNGERNVFIEGYVSSVQCDLFAQGEIAQISILCPYPYFKDMSEIVNDISNTIGLFVFPFTINENEPIPISDQAENRETQIYNSSLNEIGIIINAQFAGNVPRLHIQNTTTGEFFEVAYPFVDLDRLTINTNSGKKSIVLLRDGARVNIFPHIVNGSTFFQLHAGANTFAFTAAGNEDKVTIQFSTRMEYAGV